ncbi:hypothetical protein BDR26DRAFT_863789 [Obelidium mucronatum]|nr:hypothetical protein BDR26DRAFT_863789 [Obelidium mucronatum]
MFSLLVAATMVQVQSVTGFENPAEATPSQAQQNRFADNFVNPNDPTRLWLPPPHFHPVTAIILPHGEVNPVGGGNPGTEVPDLEEITDAVASAGAIDATPAVHPVASTSEIYSRFHALNTVDVDNMSIEDLETFAERRHESCKQELDAAYHGAVLALRLECGVRTSSDTAIPTP